MKTNKGILVISLDFELQWGVRDRSNIEAYKENLLGVRSVIPQLLNLFRDYNIHATWGTVGLLFFKTKADLIAGLPNQQPKYKNYSLSPYQDINIIGEDEQADPFHYAPSLIDLITTYNHQEIATHTFSHYYCLEAGQNIEEFQADLEAATKIAKNYNLSLKSLIFPRNQFNQTYIKLCEQVGIQAYRGNEFSWIYQARSRDNESIIRRGLRLIDAYINLSGHNAYSLNDIAKKFPFNIPSSRFLRPYSHRLKNIEPLRLQRILSDITYAAKKGLVYHLWWHPHNFGLNTNENMEVLKQILDHYLTMQKSYDMQSLNMREVSQELITHKHKCLNIN